MGLRFFTLQESMKSEYDAFADHFSRTRGRAWSEFDLIFPFVKKKDRLLDLGCGNGRLRKFLGCDHLSHGHYFGFDISQKLLDIARNSFPKDHFFRGDFAQKLPFGDDNFEIVVGIASFHHLLSKKDQLFFLSECARVLKSGGILFLTTWKLPSKYFWSNILRGRWRNWLVPFGHDKKPRTYRRVNHEMLNKLCLKSGFKVLRSELFRERNYIVLARKS